MIDPTKLHSSMFQDYDRLQEFAIFCILVAGKTAKVVSRQLEAICKEAFYYRRKISDIDLFTFLGTISNLSGYLRRHGVGCYRMKAGAIKELVNRTRVGKLNLRTCTPEALESIPGIGPKTSRFFITYTRPNVRYAILDTHVLAWLREHGHNTPKTTPQGSAYAKWEQVFLAEMDKVAPGIPVSKFDLQIWKERAKK